MTSPPHTHLPPLGNRDEHGQPPPLHADMVFAVIGLAAALNRCLGFYLPQCIQALSEGLVSIERVRDFLLLPDKKPSRLLEAAPEFTVSGCVEHLSARYQAEALPVLTSYTYTSMP